MAAWPETLGVLAMRGRKGPRDISKKTIPQLQNTLWPIFAAYIKAVHGSRCFTCNKQCEEGSRDLQAGHWIPRTYSPTKYDEDNVRPQCGQCNEYYAGKPVEFERSLRLEIGDEAVEALKRKSTERWKWSREYLINQIDYFKQALKDRAA